AFAFVYQSASGDCSIVARVLNVQNTDPAAKAGVMVRETLNSNSTEASMFLTPTNGLIVQARTSTGGTVGSTNVVGKLAPYWLKGVRTGNTYYGYYSPDGITWTPFASQSITMGTSVYIGLAVSSRFEGILCTATFDNVTSTP